VARIFSTALKQNPSFDFDKFFLNVRLIGGDTLRKAIQDILETEVLDPLEERICARINLVQESLARKVVLFNPVSRALRLAADVFTGAIDDLETFELNVIGFRFKVPNALILPLRSLSDSLNDIVLRLEDFVAQIGESISDLSTICSGGFINGITQNE